MIEAMKLALEALEDFVDVIKYDNEQDDIGRRACCDVLSYNPHSESCKAKQAITAIKAALAQPEQEPVAWLEPEWREKICPEVGYEVTITSDHPRDLCWIPLYPRPPQRTWVELTDEEINDIVEDCDGVGWDVAQAIRAKLKEKNNA